MKTTLGVSTSHTEMDIAFENLSRLRLQNLNEISCVYVIEHLGKADAILGVDDYLDSISGAPFYALQNQCAEAALIYARENAAKIRMPCTSHILSGQVANRLLSFARDEESSLLVLGSSERSPMESILIGSVARKCVINSPISLLINKRAFPERPLKAVLATDHSEYNAKCVRQLLEFNPLGISELVVTTAFPARKIHKRLSHTRDLHIDIEAAISKELEARNQKLIDSLKHWDCRFTSRVEADNPEDALKRVMLEEQADLLIIGAQGHGFSERMAMGSVSLHMAMHEPKSQLILRI